MSQDDEDCLFLGWRKRKGETKRIDTARNGDDLFVSFECDVYIFCNFYHQDSELGNSMDDFALSCTEEST